MEKLALRKAVAEDIDKIMQIEEESFLPGIREERSVFKKRLELCPETFLMLVFEKERAGYLCAEYIKKIPENAKDILLGHEPEKEYSSIIYLSSFAILPEFRGRGNGEAFWNLSMKYFSSLSGVEKLVLLVNENWSKARKIYEKSGFKQIKIFKDFFESEGKKEDGILMEKNLSSEKQGEAFK